MAKRWRTILAGPAATMPTTTVDLNAMSLNASIQPKIVQTARKCGQLLE